VSVTVSTLSPPPGGREGIPANGHAKKIGKKKVGVWGGGIEKSCKGSSMPFRKEGGDTSSRKGGLTIPPRGEPNKIEARHPWNPRETHRQTDLPEERSIHEGEKQNGQPYQSKIRISTEHTNGKKKGKGKAIDTKRKKPRNERDRRTVNKKKRQNTTSEGATLTRKDEQGTTSVTPLLKKKRGTPQHKDQMSRTITNYALAGKQGKRLKTNE